MDIVSRLKHYLENAQISVTQFADTCGIPRPSASQLLNGRNKKVSDEVITKIHQSYPSLSMLWLLFGEGNMESTANIETSAPQIEPNLPFPTTQPSDNPSNEVEISFASQHTVSDHEKNRQYLDTVHDEDPTPYFNSSSGSPNREDTAAKQHRSATKPGDSFTFTTDTRKRVMSIVVYYDDNSFESFIPDPSRRTPFSR